MYDVNIHCIVFKLCVAEEEGRKNEDERTKTFTLGFLNFEKG